ncbi:MAG: GTP cyclohydrolase I FolE [Planctomycetota bacterium]
MSFDKEKMEDGVRMLLEGMGYDPGEPGLAETPRRVADMYEEVLAGLHKDPAEVIKVLEGETFDEIVLVRGIPFYSLCEHHLLPFHGSADVAYIPENNRITGISKLARMVEMYARRLQVQERMTRQIGDSLMETLAPKGVMVVLEAEHLCMTMRGVQKPGSITVTSVVRGIFRDNQATRSEAMSLIQQDQ